MWSDNETAIDLLGFQLHSDLIQSVVTDTSLLPITIGVFGDWGSGKSSVMRMLEHDLKSNERIATIRFNGWQFEGYDEAKSALIHSILLELAEHQKLAPQIKAKIRNLFDKVDWMRVFNIGYQLTMPFVTAWMASQTGNPMPIPTSTPSQLASPPPSPFVDAQEKLAEDVENIDLTELLKRNPANQGVLGARKFREEFEKLVAETNLDSIVILVDDLDRCEPKRLVETLEAIKLFLAVPHVAFVIGADERIVRYAIAKRYETEGVAQEVPPTESQTDLVTDYLEKLIQVPYHLPRLSESEIETYMCLLFCIMYLKDKFPAIHQEFKKAREKDATGTFGFHEIQDASSKAQVELPDKLLEELAWCNTIAPSLSDILKGNPRQTKRLLNALLLRRKLAEAAHLTNLSEQVLVKLMLLEYIRPRLFAQLYKWQSSQKGLPVELTIFEKEARGEATGLSAADKLVIEQNADWKEPTTLHWLTMAPSLTGTDLRDYFWITRDRVTGILSGVSTVPLHMRQIVLGLMELEADGVFPKELQTQVQQLSSDEQNIILDDLGARLKRLEEKDDLLAVWDKLCTLVPFASKRLLDYLDQIPPQNLPRGLPMKIAALVKEHSEIKSKAITILGEWSRQKIPLGRAAEEALKTLRGGT